jgi:geranylgeranyl pyrophosphate synthase
MIDLIIDLIAKMANGDLKDSVISEKQKSLIHAVQFLHIGNLVHQYGIFDLSVFPDYGNGLRAGNDLIIGNKIALLAGDFLLAKAQIIVSLIKSVKGT